MPVLFNNTKVKTIGQFYSDSKVKFCSICKVLLPFLCFFVCLNASGMNVTHYVCNRKPESCSFYLLLFVPVSCIDDSMYRALDCIMCGDWLKCLSLLNVGEYTTQYHVHQITFEKLMKIYSEKTFRLFWVVSLSLTVRSRSNRFE